MKTFRSLVSSPGFLAVAAFSMYPSSAFAWDGTQNGRITQLDVVTNGENFGFRVTTDGQPACGAGSPGWSYLNKSANNYDAMVTMLTAHYLNGKAVFIYTTKVGSYCEIGYAHFRF